MIHVAMTTTQNPVLVPPRQDAHYHEHLVPAMSADGPVLVAPYPDMYQNDLLATTSPGHAVHVPLKQGFSTIIIIDETSDYRDPDPEDNHWPEDRLAYANAIAANSPEHPIALVMPGYSTSAVIPSGYIVPLHIVPIPAPRFPTAAWYAQYTPLVPWGTRRIVFVDDSGSMHAEDVQPQLNNYLASYGAGWSVDTFDSERWLVPAIVHVGT